MSKAIWIAVLIGIFLGLRLYRIEDRVNFSMDQGMFMSRAKEIWDNRELTLLGPTTSAVVEGRHFFQGPIIYYLLALMGWLGGWDPLMVSVEMTLLALIGTILLYKVLLKRFGEKTATYWILLMTVLPIMIKFSNFIWNPNFLMLVTPLFLAAMISGWWLMAGVMAGVGLQLHFQFGIIIVGSMGWMLIKKRKSTWKYGIGLLAGYSPLILFDLRNNFYNSKTFWLWLTSGSSGGVGFQTHYFISIAIVVVFVLSVLVAKLSNRAATVLLLIIVGFSIYKYELINSDYKMVLRIEKIILKDKPVNFNIVNLLTGDTRFYSLRYLLTKDGVVPTGVDEYPKSKTIYVFSDKMAEEFLEKPVWETENLKIDNLVKVTKIDSKTSLYKFERI